MKNFRNLRAIEGLKYAEVDVDVGFFGRLKTVTIFREGYFWRYLDSGQHCSGTGAESLEDAYCAQHNAIRNCNATKMYGEVGYETKAKSE